MPQYYLPFLGGKPGLRASDRTRLGNSPRANNDGAELVQDHLDRFRAYPALTLEQAESGWVTRGSVPYGPAYDSSSSETMENANPAENTPPPEDSDQDTCANHTEHSEPFSPMGIFVSDDDSIAEDTTTHNTASDPDTQNKDAAPESDNHYDSDASPLNIKLPGKRKGKEVEQPSGSYMSHGSTSRISPGKGQFYIPYEPQDPTKGGMDSNCSSSRHHTSHKLSFAKISLQKTSSGLTLPPKASNLTMLLANHPQDSQEASHPHPSTSGSRNNTSQKEPTEQTTFSSIAHELLVKRQVLERETGYRMPITMGSPTQSEKLEKKTGRYHAMRRSIMDFFRVRKIKKGN